MPFKLFMTDILITLFLKEIIKKDSTEKLALFFIKMLDNSSEIDCDKWKYSLIASLNCLEWDFVENKIMFPLFTIMTETKSQTIRLSIAEVLAFMLRKCLETGIESKKLMNSVIELSNDIDYKMRITCAKCIKIYFYSIKNPIFRTAVQNEILKLLMDDEVAVFYEAINLIDIALLEISNNLNKPILEGDLVRVLITKYERKFDSAEDNSLIHFNMIDQLILGSDTIPIEVIGRIIQAYNVFHHQEIIFGKNIKIGKYPILFMADHYYLIEKFIKIPDIDRNDLNLRPMIDLELPIKLLDITSPYEIKLLVLSIIEKIFKFYLKTENYPIMWKLIEIIISCDTRETLIIVWQKIPDLISMAIPPENYNEMKLYEQFQEKLKLKILSFWSLILMHNWRIKSAFCISLPPLIKAIKNLQFEKFCFEKLHHFLLYGDCKTKKVAAEIICICCYQTLNYEIFEDTTNFFTQLVSSKRFYERITFIDIANFGIKYFSQPYYFLHFLPAILQLGLDPTPMIRQKIINVLPLIIKKIKNFKLTSYIQENKMFNSSDQNEFEINTYNKSNKSHFFSEISSNSEISENNRYNDKEENKGKDNSEINSDINLPLNFNLNLNFNFNSKLNSDEVEKNFKDGNFNVNVKYWIQKIHEMYELLMDDKDRIVKIFAENIKIEMISNFDYEDNKSDSLDSDLDREKQLHKHELLIIEIHEKELNEIKESLSKEGLLRKCTTENFGKKMTDMGNSPSKKGYPSKVMESHKGKESKGGKKLNESNINSHFSMKPSSPVKKVETAKSPKKMLTDKKSIQRMRRGTLESEHSIPKKNKKRKDSL